MTAGEYVVGNAALLVVLLIFWIWHRVDQRNRWPAPEPRIHCDHCWRSYRSRRTLAFHLEAEHLDVELDTYDGGRW